MRSSSCFAKRLATVSSALLKSPAMLGTAANSAARCSRIAPMWRMTGSDTRCRRAFATYRARHRPLVPSFALALVEPGSDLRIAHQVEELAHLGWGIGNRPRSRTGAEVGTSFASDGAAQRPSMARMIKRRRITDISRFLHRTVGALETAAEDCRCITSCSAIRYDDATFDSHFVDDTPIAPITSPREGFAIDDRFVLRFPGRITRRARHTHSNLIRRRSACSALGSTLLGATARAPRRRCAMLLPWV